MNQLTLTDIEYSNRKKKTKLEEFLDSMKILGRLGLIFQMKESKMPFMTAMPCAPLCT